MEQLVQLIKDLCFMAVEFVKGIVYLAFNINDIIGSPAVIIFVIIILAIAPKKLFR